MVDRVSFRSIYVVGFVLFLAVAVLGQTLTLNWRRWLPEAEDGTTMLQGIKSSVYTFMSYVI